MSEEIGRLGSSKKIHDPLFVPSEAADWNKHEIYEFGPFRLEIAEQKLLRNGEAVPLTPKVFDMLVMLVRNSGHLVEKDELIRSLWPDSFVEESNLSTNIFMLRKALGNDHEYIETVPRRGYRFVGAARQFPPIGRNSISGALEEQRREVPSLQSPRAWKILIAAVAAALLLLAVVFSWRLFRGASPASGPSPPHLAVEQRLTANPADVPVQAAAISTDGKYLAYSDPTGLYLRQISSGETRRWSLPKDFVAFPRCWYPDGAHLLIVRDPRNPLDSSRPKPSLYKLSILGGEPQKIVSDAWGGSLSPDGSRIAYLSPDNGGDLWIMDSDGANARKVVAGPEPNKGGAGQDLIWRVVWSPSGEHLAYIEAHSRSAPDPVEPISSLRIVDPDGRGARVVLEDARLGPVALWWRSEDRILFSYREDPANAQRNYGVYSIRIDGRTGNAIGPPQPVTRAEGFVGGMTGTADGKQLVLWRSRAPAQVFLSDFDARTRQWKEPRRLVLDANENFAWAWTADSKAVFFVSNRNGTWKLFKQAIDETSPDVLAEGLSISLPRLSADGKQVLYLSSSNPEDASFPAEIMSKPVAGGPARVVIRGKEIGNFQCAMAPSTMCLFSQIDGRGDDVFRVFDLEQGAGRELLKLPHQIGSLNRNWSLSSDGAKLALFLDQHRIRFFSVATGAALDVTVKGWPLINGDWGANSQTVFMPCETPDGVPVILEIDQTGKAKVVLQGKPNTDFDWMIQSPDSRHAVVGESIPTDNDAWILSDF
jgi:DNA-binding winged helix-turn-helix (wHTH) protein/Tol biopolymer transport system component